MTDNNEPAEDEAETPPPDLPDASNAKQTRKRKLAQSIKERQEREWWTQALSTETGRRCLWQILSAAKTFGEPFGVTDVGFPHREATWFIAGKQKMGLDLYHTWLRMDPTAIAAMHRENDPRFIQTKDIK